MSGPDADGLARLVGELEGAVSHHTLSSWEVTRAYERLVKARSDIREWVETYRRGLDGGCSAADHREMQTGLNGCPRCGVVLAGVIADA